MPDAQLFDVSSIGTRRQRAARVTPPLLVPATPVVSCESFGRHRPAVHGKFLASGDRKIYVRGVTYGAFRPDAQGHEYHDLDVIERDFAQMAANGFNAVRIPHTMPPRALLDVAYRHGLWVMVGLSAEQLIGFIIDKRRDV